MHETWGSPRIAKPIRDAPCTAAGTSRTFQRLARLCGAAPASDGPFARRDLARLDLRGRVRQLSGMPAAQRARLAGISASRARQSLAGAVVAHTAMKLMGIDVVTICPWTVREGILLRHVEDAAWWAGLGYTPTIG